MAYPVKDLTRSALGAAVTALPLVVLCAAVAWVAPTYYQHLAVSAWRITAIAPLSGLGLMGAAILATPLMMKKLSIPNAPFGLSEVVLSPLLAALISLAIVAVLALASGRIIARLSGVPG